MKTKFALLCLLLPFHSMADVIWDGSDTEIIIRINDTCQNVNLNLTWSYSVNGGSVQTGSYNGWNTSRGNFEIGDIFPTPTLPNVSLTYNITPTSLSSTPYNNQNVQGEGSSDSFGYTATTPDPCGSFADEINKLPLAVTNFTSFPLMLPDGNVLSPGQSTNWIWTPPLGQSNSVTFQTLNQNAQWQDSGGIQVTSGWNSSYPPQYVYATNDLPFTMQPLDGNALGNGGGIVWNNTNTTAANNGTLESGFSLLNNDILAQQSSQNNQLSNLISRLDNPASPLPVSFTNQISIPGMTNIFNGASNVWVENFPSNFDNGASTNSGAGSNVWVQNWPFSTNETVSNAFSYMLSQTNQAYTVLNPIASAQSSFVGSMPSSLGDQSGSPQEQDIQIGPPSQPITIAMGVLPTSVSNPFASLRSLIAWIIVAILFFWNFATLFDAMENLLKTPQAQGPDTGAVVSTFFGNVFSAGFCALLIISLVSILPVVAIGFLAGELSFFSGGTTTNPISFFNVMGWAYQFLSQFIPIYTLITAFGVRVGYWFAVRSLEVTLSAVIKMLIGT